MNVLFLGGSRFFGPLIVESLARAGHQVTVITRGNLPLHFKTPVQHMTFDRRNPAELRSKLDAQSFGLVIDNIAYTAPDVETLLPFIKKWSARYILTSTALVYWCSNKHTPFSEEDVDWSRVEEFSHRPEHQYTYGKLRCEQVLRAHPEVRSVVVRPPIIWGPGDYTLRIYFYIQRLLDGEPLLLTSAKGAVHSFAFSEDLARFYCFLATAPANQVEKQSFNFAQPETFSMEGLLSLLAGTDVSSRLIRVSSTQLSFDYQEPLLDPATYQPSIAKCRGLFDSFTPAGQWLKKTFDWYQETPQEQHSLGYNNRALEIEYAKKFKLS